MEWVETTAKTVDDAKAEALDQLGVEADEAEFDVLEEPRPGLFGRVRGTARVRARIRPTPVRPKNDRRRSSKRGGGKKSAESRSSNRSDRGGQRSAATASSAEAPASESSDVAEEAAVGSSGADGSGSTNSTSGSSRRRSPNRKKAAMTQDQETVQESPVSPEEVGDAAVAFVDGLVTAFGGDGTTSVAVEGTELDVSVAGSDLGLLVGPRGRTLLAVQDLTRVAAQRRLGDQTTRLRVDVGGYRERRSAALESFAASVAEQVRESGVARALEPMASADRKVVHDALNDTDGVTSRSEGDDPNRYIVVAPA